MSSVTYGTRIRFAIVIVFGVVPFCACGVGAEVAAFGYGAKACNNWFRCVYETVENRESVVTNLQQVVGTADECTNFYARYAYAVAAIPAGPPDGCTDTEMVALVGNTTCTAAVIDPACHTRHKVVPLTTTAAFMCVIGLSSLWNVYELVSMYKQANRLKFE